VGWQRPTWKRHTSDTRILWTSLDKRWILKKEMKCGWTSRIFYYQKVWAQVLGTIFGSIQNVGKEISQRLQIRTTGKS
jgi:hypothetical protein